MAEPIVEVARATYERRRMHANNMKAWEETDDTTKAMWVDVTNACLQAGVKIGLVVKAGKSTKADQAVSLINEILGGAKATSSTDPFNRKQLPGEPVFTLYGLDLTAPTVAEEWVLLNRRKVDQDLIVAAQQRIEEMREWGIKQEKARKEAEAHAD